MEGVTLIEVLEERARTEGSAIAYTFVDDEDHEPAQLTYGQLDQRARVIAGLVRDHVGAGARALLVYPAGLDFIAAFFGCLYAGVVGVPVYPPDPLRPGPTVSRLACIAKDAGATCALTTAALADAVSSGGWAEELRCLRWLATDASEGEATSDRQSASSSARQALAFLQYTSGSTGRPKGVMVTHGNVLEHGKLCQRILQAERRDVMVSWLPLNHDMGLIGTILYPLQAGFRSIQMSPGTFLKRPYRWLRAIADYGGTVSVAPNFAYDICVRKITLAQAQALDLSRWRAALNGSERVRKDTMERFARTFEVSGFRREAFMPCYGLAEATLMVSAGARSAGIVSIDLRREALSGNVLVGAGETDAPAAMMVGCGAVADGQRVAIVRPESGVRAGDAEVGEIWVTGPCVAQGYWQNPEETVRTFDARMAGTGEGPFLRTGDLGFVREGQLFITGRMKDVIIIRGSNHYPDDIEKTVEESHASLRAGGAVAFTVDGTSEERLVVVQEVGTEDMDAQAVAEAICTAVARAHRLRVDCVVLVKARSVPKTSSGKVQRRLCRRHFLEGRLDAIGEWRNGAMSAHACGDASAQFSRTGNGMKAKEKDLALDAGRIRDRLVAVIAELRGLPVSEIDVRKDMAAYGLDSAEAATLAADLEEWMDMELPVAAVWESPTIERLAGTLACMPARRERGATSAQARPQWSGPKSASDEHEAVNGRETSSAMPRTTQ